MGTDSNACFTVNKVKLIGFYNETYLTLLDTNHMPEAIGQAIQYAKNNPKEAVYLRTDNNSVEMRVEPDAEEENLNARWRSLLLKGEGKERAYTGSRSDPGGFRLI